MKIDLPESLTTAHLVDDFQKQGPPRAHLGASVLGHECERWLWLSFRWAIVERFPGRILRLFRRGQMEEYTVIADLRQSLIEVTECLDEQRQIDFGGHVKGSPDGVVYGIPESPKKEHLLEIKTHSKKSFDEVSTQGVQKAKPMHYTQMQVGMLGRRLQRALYYAVCKDDDRIYTERVYFEKEYAERMLERAKRIALEERLPAPITDDPTWYKCRFCPAHDFCFGDKKPLVNCRTCAHATPLADGTWHCARWDAVLPVDGQRQGCRSHVIHPDLTSGEFKEYDQWSCYYDGVLVGEAGVSTLEYLYGEAGLTAEIFNGEVVSPEGVRL